MKIKVGKKVYCIVNKQIISGNVIEVTERGVRIDTTDKFIYSRNIFTTKEKAQTAINSRAINRQKNWEKHIAKEHRQQRELEGLFYSYK